MRHLRTIASQTQDTYFHVLSPCTEKAPLLVAEEQQVFVDFLHRIAAFSGVDVLTYCVMPDYCQLLVRVQKPAALDESELLGRLAAHYGPDFAAKARARWAAYRRFGRPDMIDRETARLARRFGNLPSFMKDLNQAFNLWYRRSHGGLRVNPRTLRYHAILVEGGAPLAALAAYVDLNPVRAGIVSDPKDYPFTGYGAAAAGDAFARKGFDLLCAAQSRSHAKAMAAYRLLLYGDPPATVTRAAIKAVLEGPNVRNTLTLPQLLRCQVRAFSAGFAIGSQPFAAGVFEDHRYAFSENRKHPPVGARLCADWRGISLFATRNLRQSAVTLPPAPARK